MKYPQHLHNSHNDYPLAPEHLYITEEMLSPYSTKSLKSLNANITSVTKLSPNLYDKTNYIVHFNNLKFYIEEGLVITKIHRILRFKQSRWMEPYVSFNTHQR